MDPLLLVVDDEPPIREYLTRCGHSSGFRVVTCEDGRAALAFLDTQSADMALVDLCMPHVDGLQVIKTIRHKDPHCQVVLMSGASGRITDAVEAIKLGARDYLQKPFQLQVLQTLLTEVRDAIDKRKNALVLERQLATELELCGMIGRSPVMQELFAMVRRLAPHVKTALVTGESGAGKDLVAAALHRLGPRANRELVVVGCAGLTDLSVLDKAGDSLVFLDEIADLSPDVQSRLLPFLDRARFALIAATRKDLRTEMLAGRMRRELYFRLSTVDLHVPPLRERKEDIPLLADAFSRECAERIGKPVMGLTAAAENLLRKRDWPGNVRELRNVIDHACMMADGELLTERDITHALGKLQ